jgi:6-pyruvoyl-tetrahydropterin synthase
MKQSELKNLVRTLLDEALAGRDVNDEIADTEPSGQAKKKVEELFNGSMVVSFTDIEEIAYSYIKDVDQAESLREELIEYAGSISKPLGYLPDARGEFFIRRPTHEDLTRQYGDKLKKPVHPFWTQKESSSDESRELRESKLNAFKKLIREAVEEVKTEDDKSVEDDMLSVLKMLKEHNKKFSFRKNKSGNYEVIGCSPTQIEVRPMYMDSYDVIFMLDGTDREKKLNLDLKGVKEFIKAKLTCKLENYTKSSFNKAANTTEDVTKKTAGLPSTKQNDIKKVGDTKNDNKDYSELDVKKEADMPEKPLREVGDVKKQYSHDDDSGAKYKFPKQDKDEKKHVLKGGKGKELKLPEKKIPKK